MTLARIVFWISLLYVAYIIGLYPLLLSYLARLFPRKPLRGPQTPTVSFVIAAYNGASFLRDKLTSILSLDYPQHHIQTIVVNDGSSDNTSEIARSFGGRVVLIDSAKVGKAGALNQGMAVATGEILVLTDVRQRLAADSLRFLMENFADPTIGTVSAELQIQAGSSNEEADTGAYWKYERWIRLNLSAIDSIFGASGSYYAIRRELAVPIPPNTLVDDMYLPLNAFFRGYRLIVDRRAKMYDYPTNLSAEFGRKVRTLAGNYQILGYYPHLLSLKNRLLFHFASYKLGRLFLPFALLTCSISSLAAGGTLATVSVCIQLLTYTAAFLDPKIPPGTLLKRITSPLRTFVVMMLATLCAISIWFLPPERLWKPTYVSRRDVPAQ
jgi:cellulose synthase/poly-beta-1,6-N-acetylglucosamine synthase-like glycosyltransferase